MNVREVLEVDFEGFDPVDDLVAGVVYFENTMENGFIHVN